MSKIISRQSNIEILRIIAMLMILLNHLAGHGIMHVTESACHYQLWSSGTIANRWSTAFFRPGGEVGVAIFFIITGYFCVSKKTVNVRRVVAQTAFYCLLNLVVLFIARIIGTPSASIGLISFIKLCVKSILTPVSSGIYWFVTVYVFVMLMTPIVNPFLIKLTKKRFFWLLVVAWFLWYVVASITGSLFFQLQKGLFFYAVGAFIRLQRGNISCVGKNRSFLVILFCVSWISGCFLHYQISSIGSTNDMRNSIIQNLCPALQTGVVTPVCAISLFKVFESIHIGSVQWINSIAATTFGVYLIHDSEVGRNLFWYDILKVDTVLYQSQFFPILAVFAGILLFAFCSLMDWMRARYIEKHYLDVANKMWNSVNKLISK